MVMPLPRMHPSSPVAADHRPRAGRPGASTPDARRAELDLDRLELLFADGARTLLLTQPHNPGGRVYTRAELRASATS